VGQKRDYLVGLALVTLVLAGCNGRTTSAGISGTTSVTSTRSGNADNAVTRPIHSTAADGIASTQAAVQPGAPVTRTTPVPILMYHAIAPAPGNAPYPDVYVTPVRFAEELAYLARHRYHVLTLQQVWNSWHGGAKLPRKPVVVSFDDGFRNWYTEAYPVLKEHGWVGTMNIAVSHLGGRNRWLKKLVAAGWELDSHTLTHADLTLLSSRDLHREVAGSRTRLRKLFRGAPVNFFCYPSGRYNEMVITEVRRAGYLGATTTDEGFAVPTMPFTLRRVRVNGSDDAAALAAKLAGS